MDDELALTDPSAVKALFDPLRFRLFGLLRTPRSVPELAGAVDMPANRLYYHVRRLVECGLVQQVETRSVGRHTERIYGRTAERFRFSGELDLGGESPLRGITQEIDTALRAASENDPASVSYHVYSLTDARARELEERLRSLIAEYDDRGRAPKGITLVRRPRRAGAPPGRRDSVIEIRALRSDELDFLREMLVAALAWRPDVELPPAEWVLAHPQVVVFHQGWGRPGDTALVASKDGHPIGLVWYRFFSDAEHGEGFVDQETPELAIAVVDGHRGIGVGRLLLEAAHDHARRDGIARISLSVDPENPARRLYERAGYLDYAPDAEDDRMVLPLA